MARVRYRPGDYDGERTDIDMADLASAIDNQIGKANRPATSRREALRRFRGDPFRCH